MSEPLPKPWTVEDYSVQTPSARGAATLVRTKLRHVVHGQLVERTFKSGEKFDEPDVAFRQIQFLYADSEACHFMDVESYDQFALALPPSLPLLGVRRRRQAGRQNGRQRHPRRDPHGSLLLAGTPARCVTGRRPGGRHLPVVFL